MKKFVVQMAVLLAVLMPVAAQAEYITYALSKPYYYKDGDKQDETPAFVSGTFGHIIVSTEELFPVPSTYAYWIDRADMPEGYYTAQWSLNGSKSILTSNNVDKISITFDYKWKSTYGTNLALIVAINQKQYDYTYDYGEGGSWIQKPSDGKDVKYWTTNTAASSNCVKRVGHTFKGWLCSTSTGKTLAGGEKFTGSTLGIQANGEKVTLTAQWAEDKYKATIATGTGGTGGSTVDYSFSTASQTKDITLPTRAGCSIEKWTAKDYFGSSTAPSISDTTLTIPANTYGNFTMTPTWKANTCTITIYPGYDGGNVQTKTYEPKASDQTVNISLPSRTEYEWASWEGDFSKVTGDPPILYKESILIPANTYGDFSITAKWTGKSYTITVSAGEGGTGGSSVSYTVTNEQQSVSFTKPTRTGYDISSWTVGSGWTGSQPTARDNEVTVPANTYGNFTITPTWSGESYTAKVLPGEGGTGGDEMNYKTSASYQYWDFSAPTKTGYHVSDWSIVGYVGSKPSISDNSRMTIYANTSGDIEATPTWEENTATIGYENYGTFGAFHPTSMTYDTNVKVSKPTKEGSAFAGWQVTSGLDTTTAQYSTDGGKTWEALSSDEMKVGASCDTLYLRNLTAKQNGVVTLYGNWSATPKYEITVRAEPTAGGTVSGGGTYDYGKSVTLTATAKAGYSFTQWNDGVTTAIREITVTGDATYTANFAAEEYYVAFDGNGATGGTPMTVQTVKVGVETKLTKNTFAKTGASFAGWATTKGGEVVYQDQQKVTDIAARGQTKTLYAVWAPWKNYVKFEGNGGEGEMAVQEFEYGVEQALSANEFAKTGYTFAGWTNETKHVGYADKQPVTFTEANNKTNTLKAVWAANSYTVAFDANGGEGSMDPLDCRYDKESTLPANEFTKTGCNFMGWATNLTSGVVFADGAKVKNLTAQAEGEVTLYAQWSYSLCCVDFKANGGEGKMAVQTFTNGIAQALSANQFEKANYTFQGWTNELKKTFYTDKQVVTFNEPDNTTNTLKAVWAINTYTMHFAPNAKTALNPTAQSDISNCVSGAEIKLPACQYINLPSQGFMGWVDKNSVTNQAGTTVTHTVAKSGEIVTYKAAWEDNSDLSKAVGLDTVTALTNQSYEAEYVWEKVLEEARSGGSCVCHKIPQGTGGMPESKVSMLVNGPGTLTFWYKKSASVVEWDYLTLEIDGEEKKWLSEDATTAYTKYTYSLKDTGLHAVTWNCWSDGDKKAGRAFYIDDVTWTPKGGKPKPLILFIR